MLQAVARELEIQLAGRIARVKPDDRDIIRLIELIAEARGCPTVDVRHAVLAKFREFEVIGGEPAALQPQPTRGLAGAAPRGAYWLTE